ncbi:hypothetical protein DL771_012389 [Monosporascus sp. 5C6A]|nr:hypothetical protein DL771_012389 [Monosporascus sp. 5C6A]
MGSHSVLAVPWTLEEAADKVKREPSSGSGNFGVTLYRSTTGTGGGMKPKKDRPESNAADQPREKLDKVIGPPMSTLPRLPGPEINTFDDIAGQRRRNVLLC